MAQIGDHAPDFELPGSDSKTHKLADYLGRPLVLAFYRGDDTMVCNRQLNEYNHAYLEWRDRDVGLIGISPDSPQSHYSFGCRLDLTFPLLSDSSKDVARLYNVPTSLIKYGRTTFVLDRLGTIRAELRPALGGLLSYPSANQVTKALGAFL